ncbi:hypothetical protein [Polaribacter atrinae]
MKNISKKIILNLLVILCYTEVYSQTLPPVENDDLRSSICRAAYLALHGPTPVVSFESVILKKIQVDFDDPNKFYKISEFLNDNHKNLICGDDSNTKHRKNEHIFKRMIALQDYAYIDHLAENDELYSINWKLYEIIEGKKETILDYVNMIIADKEKFNEYDEDGLFELRDMLIEMGVKKGSEL